jgi:hypothetical protein
MALSAATVLEIEIGGSDTNGGGFVTGASGTDWSKQSSPQYSVTDGVTAGTTTITSATAAFGTDVVGNLIYVQGGTGSVTAGWYQITVRNSSTSITVDRSTGLTSGTGVTLHVGGAFATPGLAVSIMTVTGMKAWWKYSATDYTITTATAGSGGPIAVQNGTVLEGYDQTRGDRTGNRPRITWPSSGVTAGSLTYLITTSGSARKYIANVAANGNNITNVGCFNLGTGATALQCTATNFGGTGGIGFTNGGTTCKSCSASSGLTGFSGGSTISDCTATSCTTGFLTGIFHTDCIATSCTNGFSTISSAAVFRRCTADSNTTAGFVVTGQGEFDSCISSNQSGAGGIGFSIGTNISTLNNCASYNNSSEVTGTALSNEGMILSASFTGGQPYVTAGSQFAPNATANSGALLRNAGIGVFGQTDNCDIGAVQHADPSASIYIFQVES